MKKLAYIAGPLFNEGERWFNELVDQIAQDAGYETFLPQRDLGILGEDQGPEDWLDAASIFKEDSGYLKRADIIIATLNGLQTDDGTAWELGHAFAEGKHIVGLFNDQRVHSKDAVLNPMIQESLNHLCHSLEELKDYLSTL